MEKRIIVNRNHITGELGDLFGIFFEDINHGADGGLYAEMVRNRSFEFAPVDHPDYHSLYGWEKVERGGGKVSLSVEGESPLHPKNPHYLVMKAAGKEGEAGIRNMGYNSGMPIRKGDRYLFRCYSRCMQEGSVSLSVAIESSLGKRYAQGYCSYD